MFSSTTDTVFDYLTTDVHCKSCGRRDIQPLRELVGSRFTMCRVCDERIEFTAEERARMEEERLGALMVVNA
jgi:hypothetical protein